MEAHPFASDRTMLKSLKIENFRGFQQFELKQLGQINLIVGSNNSGKTSILEAVNLLCARSDLEPLRRIMFSRGELSRNEESRPGTRREQELDIRHLFNGHQIAIDSEFRISASRLSGEDIFAGIVRMSEFVQGEVFSSSDSEQSLRDIELHFSWNNDGEMEEVNIPLSLDSGISMDDARRRLTYSKRIKNSSNKNLVEKVNYISSSSITVKRMVELFDQIVLTPEEDSVVQALQTIDSKIVRIASLGESRNPYSERSGFVVKYQNLDHPIPIGNMGDGVWRMLGLAMSVTCSKGGIVLVDEIDTGLHFSTMESMWRIILKTAKLLNVQVFATTHSRDCWESLAQVVEDEEISRDEVVIHRIEPQKSHSVEFDGRLMSIAMDENIEVR